MISPTLYLETLVVRIVGDATKFNATMQEMEGGLRGFMGSVAALGLPLSIVGTLAVKTFAKFDDSLNRSMTLFEEFRGMADTVNLSKPFDEFKSSATDAFTKATQAFSALDDQVSALETRAATPFSFQAALQQSHQAVASHLAGGWAVIGGHRIQVGAAPASVGGGRGGLPFRYELAPGNVLGLAKGAYESAAAAVGNVGSNVMEQVRNIRESTPAARVAREARTDEYAARARLEIQQQLFDISNKSIISSTDLAHALGLLGRSGRSAGQALDELRQIERFSVATDTDVTKATKLVLDIQGAMGMKSKDVNVDLENQARIMRVLAAGSTLAQVSAERFGEGLDKYGGAQLADSNKSLEEGAAVLATYAQEGIVGGEATQKLYMLLSSMPRTMEKNSAGWSTLGIKIYDTNLKLKPMWEIVALLEDKFRAGGNELNQMAKQMAGLDVRAWKAIVPLIGHSQQMKELYYRILAFNDVERMAEMNMRSFTSQLTVVWNNLKNIGIGIAEILLPHMRSLIVGIHYLMDAWSESTSFTKSFIVNIGLASASVGLFFGALYIGKSLLGLFIVPIAAVAGVITALIPALQVMKIGFMGLWYAIAGTGMAAPITLAVLARLEGWFLRLVALPFRLAIGLALFTRGLIPLAASGIKIGFDALRTGIGYIIPAFKFAGFAIQEFLKYLIFSFKPVQFLTTAFLMLGSGIAKAFFYLTELPRILAGLAMTGIQGLISGILRSIPALLEGLASFLTAAISIAPVLAIVGSIAGTLLLLHHRGYLTFAAMKNGLKDFWTFTQGFLSHFEENWDILLNWLGDNWENLLEDMLGNAGKFIKNLGLNLLTGLQASMSLLKLWFQTNWDAITENVGIAIDKLGFMITDRLAKHFFGEGSSRENREFWIQFFNPMSILTGHREVQTKEEREKILQSGYKGLAPPEQKFRPLGGLPEGQAEGVLNYWADKMTKMTSGMTFKTPAPAFNLQLPLEGKFLVRGVATQLAGIGGMGPAGPLTAAGVLNRPDMISTLAKAVRDGSQAGVASGLEDMPNVVGQPLAVSDYKQINLEQFQLSGLERTPVRVTETNDKGAQGWLMRIFQTLNEKLNKDPHVTTR